MKLENFDFVLPPELIAQNPVVPRDSSRMLVYDSAVDKIYDKHFYDLPEFLTEKDVVVVNRSKVRSARVIFEDDGLKELFVLKDLGENRFQCMVRPGRYFQIGRRGKAQNLEFLVQAILEDGTREVEFFGEDIAEKLEEIGGIPLPPYIDKSAAADEQYQTVYADRLGSVAAPTAGLHFTERVFGELRAKGVGVEKLTLHVGRGTFLPVKSEDVREHVMHGEEFELDEETAARLTDAAAGGKEVVAVGTTAVRTLESNFVDGRFLPGRGETDIFIYPGYEWKVVRKLITNFHLPKSTLIMLVAAFLEGRGVADGVGKVQEIYAHAIKERYRFYSFGDCCLIL